jgi:hypothetical protein
MKATIFSLLLTCLVIQSCKREAKETTINGQVRTFGTTEAIRHTPVKIQLLAYKSSKSINSGSTHTLVDEMITDENGNFTLSGNLHSEDDNFLYVVPTTVSPRQGYIPPSLIPNDRGRISSVGGTITQNFYIYATGWVRFHFKGEIQGPDNHFWYNTGPVYERLTGTIDEYRFGSFSGNVNHQIACGIVQDGIRTNWQETFFVNAFDTIDYQVKF